MPHVLVTGGSGFIGRHLVEELNRSEDALRDFVAAGRNRPKGVSAGQFFQVGSRGLFCERSTREVVGSCEPSVVFHLATPPRDEAGSEVELLEPLARALAARDAPTTLIIAGSAAELGHVPNDRLPVDEAFEGEPLDDYGRGKKAATTFALGLDRTKSGSGALTVVVGRIFNAIGPGMPERLAFGRFARALADPIDPVRLSVGRLDSRRDFVDVRDVARGLIALARSGRGGEVYNIASGASRAVGDGLDELIRLSGKRVVVEADHARTTTAAAFDSRGAIAKIRREAGWSAEVPFERSLGDLWRELASAPRPYRIGA